MVDLAHVCKNMVGVVVGFIIVVVVDCKSTRDCGRDEAL